MQTICTSLQTDNHINTSSLKFYRPDALHDAQATVSKHYSCGAPVDLKVHESDRACLSYTDADAGAGYCSWLSTHSTSPSATLMMRCTHDSVMPRPRRHALTGPPPPLLLLLLTAVMMVAVVCTYVRMYVCQLTFCSHRVNHLIMLDASCVS